VGERLYRDFFDRKEKWDEQAAAASGKESEELKRLCTLQPKLSATTKRIIKELRGASPPYAALAAAALASSGEVSPFSDFSAAAAVSSPHLPRHLQLYAEGLRKQKERREHAELVAQAGGLIRVEDALECTFSPKRGPDPPPRAGAGRACAAEEHCAGPGARRGGRGTRRD
jgi:hypothetical protein